MKKKVMFCEHAIANPYASGDGDDTAAELKKLQNQVSDLVGQIDSLKTKNSQLIGEKRDLQEKVKSFGDLDPTKITEMMKVFDSSEEAKLIADGKLDEVVNKRVEKKLGALETQITTLSEQLTTEKQKSSDALKMYSKERVETALRSAAEQNGVLPSAIDDVVARANGVFALGEDNSIEARDAKGNLVKVDGKTLTPDLFVKGLREKATHFWPSSQSANAHGKDGKDNGVNPFAKDSWNLTKQAQLRQENPEEAARLEKEAKAA